MEKEDEKVDEVEEEDDWKQKYPRGLQILP